LKIACKVRRWRSVNTKRGFFGAVECSETIGWLSSFRLQGAKTKHTNYKYQWNCFLSINKCI
jgi:hypothetical protein